MGHCVVMMKSPVSTLLFRSAALLVLLVLAGWAAEARAARRPNLVFVIDDQHSADMLGCYGNPDVQTPRLDALARAGVRFAHCVSNSPVCTPYRGILLSGQHPLRCGTIQNDLQLLPGGGRYLPEVLRDAGYRMGYFGKWHLYGGDRERGVPAGPLRYGFDHEFLTNNCTLVFDAARAFYWDQEGREKKLYGDWEPYAQARQAMEFVDRHAGDPFALFVAWHPPHNWATGAMEGYDAPKELLALYDPAKLTLRPTVPDNPRTRRMYHGHMAMISGVDRAFGMLLDKLQERGLEENTLVVFTADHGDMLRSYGWAGNKGRAESSSCRVPLLMRWPGQLAPGTSDLLVGTLDLMPTVLGLLGLPVPETCQGRNAAEAIRTGRADGVEALPLFYLPLNWRGVYTRRHTYSVALHDPDEAGVPGGRKTFNVLYDRQADPAETRNLFDAPEAADLRAGLHAQTLEMMRRFGDGGLRSSEISRRVVADEDLAVVQMPLARRHEGWNGRLKGRPVDLLPAPEPAEAPQR